MLYRKARRGNEKKRGGDETTPKGGGHFGGKKPATGGKGDVYLQEGKKRLRGPGKKSPFSLGGKKRGYVGKKWVWPKEEQGARRGTRINPKK